MPSSILSWTLALALATTSTPAPPDELDPRARELLERGIAAYERGDFPAAIAAFEEGYAIQPAPVFLYTWAQAARYMDDCETAVELYDRFLATDPPVEQRTATEEYRAKCIPPTEPPSGAVLPAPPPRVVEPQAIETAPVDEAPPAAAPRRRRDPLGPSLVAIGVALTATGIGLATAGGLAARAEADARVYEDFRDQHRRKIGFLASGIPLAGIGVGLLVGGIVRLVVRRRADRSLARRSR